MRRIRPQNAITSIAGEKRPPRGPVRRKPIEKRFLLAGFNRYGFSPGRAALRYPLARRYRLVIYNTALDAAHHKDFICARREGA